MARPMTELRPVISTASHYFPGYPIIPGLGEPYVSRTIHAVDRVSSINTRGSACQPRLAAFIGSWRQRIQWVEIEDVLAIGRAGQQADVRAEADRLRLEQERIRAEEEWAQEAERAARCQEQYEVEWPALPKPDAGPTAGPTAFKKGKGEGKKALGDVEGFPKWDETVIEEMEALRKREQLVAQAGEGGRTNSGSWRVRNGEK